MSREQYNRVNVDGDAYQRIKKAVEQRLQKRVDDLNDLTAEDLTRLKKIAPEMADELAERWRLQSYR